MDREMPVNGFNVNESTGVPLGCEYTAIVEKRRAMLRPAIRAVAGGDKTALGRIESVGGGKRYPFRSNLPHNEGANTRLGTIKRSPTAAIERK